MKKDARSAARIYDPPGVRLLVKGEEASIYSLSATGIGVFLEDRFAFDVGDPVRPLRLEAEDVPLELAAEVIHISRGSVFFPDRRSEREFYLFGLKFMFADPDTKRDLEGLIGRLLRSRPSGI